MPQTATKQTPGAAAARATLRVTGYGDGEITGWLDNAYYHKAVPVKSSLQLLFRLESMFDALGFPRKFFELRSLNGAQKESERKSEAMDAEKKETQQAKATFVIQVQFRRNATWQGELQWVDGNQTQRFRSALELVKMIDETLARGEQREPELWEG